MIRAGLSGIQHSCMQAGVRGSYYTAVRPFSVGKNLIDALLSQKDGVKSRSTGNKAATGNKSDGDKSMQQNRESDAVKPAGRPFIAEGLLNSLKKRSQPSESGGSSGSIKNLLDKFNTNKGGVGAGTSTSNFGLGSGLGASSSSINIAQANLGHNLLHTSRDRDFKQPERFSQSKPTVNVNPELGKSIRNSFSAAEKTKQAHSSSIVRKTATSAVVAPTAAASTVNKESSTGSAASSTSTKADTAEAAKPLNPPGWGDPTAQGTRRNRVKATTGGRTSITKMNAERAERVMYSNPQTASRNTNTNNSNAGSILNSLSESLPYTSSMGDGLGNPSIMNEEVDLDALGLTVGELRVRKHEEKMRRRAEKNQQDMWHGASHRDQRTTQLSFADAQRNESRTAVLSDKSSRGKNGNGHSPPGEAMGLTPAQVRQRIALELLSKQNRSYVPTDVSLAQERVVEVIKPVTQVKIINIPAKGLTIRELAIRLSVRLEDVYERLRSLGDADEEERARQAQKTISGKNKGKRFKTTEEENTASERLLDPDLAELIALDSGVDVRREKKEQSDKTRERSGALGIELAARDPIVAVMGHVDHGKTTLLDTLRKANVAAGEAGGITQRLSAFRVSNMIGALGRQVVFLDTPGHAAFTTMRSHGVSATDMVVLVVAIDDGVKTQTLEALKTAIDAKCTVIVALNKVDKLPDKQQRTEARSRVLAQLVEYGLVAEDFGGDTIVVETAAMTGEGLETLVDSILLQADMMELQASSIGQCEAVVLDAAMEKGRGVVADVLVHWGKLSVGDSIIVDTMYGKVKAMEDDTGKAITSAGPSTPVRLLGLRTVPTAGQELLSVDSEARARQIAERRLKVQEIRAERRRTIAAEALIGTKKGITPTLDLVLKADGVGSLEALEQVVRVLSNRTKEVNINIVLQAVGDINRRDVETASSSNAIVLGFNVGIADSSTRSLAKELDVVLSRDNIIYRLEEKLLEEMKNLLPKDKTEVEEGHAIVQKVFTLNDKKSTNVAGMMVQKGSLRTVAGNGASLCFTVTRMSAAKEHADICRRIEKDSTLADPDVPNAPHVGYDTSPDCDLARGIVFRENIINEETVELKRFKDVVTVVESGSDCGFVLKRFQTWQEGDIINCYRVVMKTRDLVLSPP